MICWVIFDWGGTIMREFEDYSGPMVDWPRVEAMPHAPEMLAALRSRYRMAIGSNANMSTPKQVRGAMQRLGVDGYFDVVQTTVQTGLSKPDPAFFWSLIEACDCRPDEAVMVGDDYIKDAVAARRAGLWSIWYNPEGKPAPESDLQPHAEVRDLLDLAEVIAGLAVS